MSTMVVQSTPPIVRQASSAKQRTFTGPLVYSSMNDSKTRFHITGDIIPP